VKIKTATEKTVRMDVGNKITYYIEQRPQQEVKNLMRATDQERSRNNKKASFFQSSFSRTGLPNKIANKMFGDKATPFAPAFVYAYVLTE
jgi:hypothetical protein